MGLSVGIRHPLTTCDTPMHAGGLVRALHVIIAQAQIVRILPYGGP